MSEFSHPVLPSTINELAQHARKHTKEMEEKYASEIMKCVQETATYTDDNPDITHQGIKKNEEQSAVFMNTDTVTALFMEGEGKTAVLNFADFLTPGGIFMQGAKTQEEALCHESFLYNVITKHPEFYKENRKWKHTGMYRNRLLYSPDVIFERSGKVMLSDVITCASPHFYARNLPFGPSKKKNSEVLESRIVFILDTAQKNHVDTIILGAFGCGVFLQEPEEVAELFSKHTPYYNFRKVVYAVPGDGKNAECFKRIVK